MIRVSNVNGEFVADSESSSGLTQVSHSSAPEPVSSPSSSKVHEGPLILDVATGEWEQTRVARYQHGAETGTPGGSVMATRQKVGGVVTVELIPGRPETRTHLTQALRDGLVIEEGPGFYRDAPQAAVAASGGDRLPPQAPQKGQQQDAPAEDPGKNYFDPQLEQAFAQATAGMHESSLDHIGAAIVAHSVNGTGTVDGIARKLAEREQMEPSQALGIVQQAIQVHQTAADRALEEVGVAGADREAFYAELRQSPGKMQDAITKLRFMRDPSAMQEAAVAWKSRQMESWDEVKLLRKGGFDVHMDRQTGSVMARQGTGNWVPALDILKRVGYFAKKG